jgi:tartrate dehydratase beta subunit/fumarate hydratase class I family protein
MCFIAATVAEPIAQEAGAMLLANTAGMAMGSPTAASNMQKFKQQFQARHGGMTAAQVVGQRGQS